jgi:preprotein translocase subunit SecE
MRVLCLAHQRRTGVCFGGHVSDSGTTTDRGSSAPKKRSEGRPGPWARLTLFLRQMVAELRKVIWPTRRELITYTWVVIIFVAIVTTIVGVFDLVFTKLVLWVFG